MRAHHLILPIVLLLASCGPPANQSGTTETPVAEAPAIPDAPPIPEVDAVLLAAPSTDFTAIEPTEIDVQGAPTLEEALAPLTVATHGESATLQVSTRESGDTAVADVVRTGLGDDSVAGAHIRLEFRREPEGWFPTNAYRRFQCARGALAGQWSASPCP